MTGTRADSSKGVDLKELSWIIFGVTAAISKEY
jgi:hypothetical protein